MARVPSTTDYNSGLPSPFPSNNGDTRSEASPQDQSAAHPYSHSEHRAYLSISATPTSDNGGYPHSARSAASYVDPYHREQLSVQGSNMASHSSSLNLQDEADVAHPEPQEDAQQLKSDPDLPIDPSIAQSPTQYAYAQNLYGHEHQQYHNPQAVYPHPSRPDWAGYNGHTPITPNHHNVYHPQTPTGRPGNQVSVFPPTRALPSPLLCYPAPTCHSSVSCARVMSVCRKIADMVMYLGVLVCAHPRFAATQASSTPLRGNRAHV